MMTQANETTEALRSSS